MSRWLATTVWLAVGCSASAATTSVFPIAQGWLGADGDTSVALASGQSLWLFDDTFVGSAQQRTRPGSTFIHNTIGLSTGSPLGGPWTVQYDWGGSNTVFFGSAETVAQSAWYWASDAATLNGQVYVALMKVVSTPNVGLGFTTTGITLATISNPTAPPGSWSIQYNDLTTTPGCYPGAAMTFDEADQYLLLYTPCDPTAGAWQKPVLLTRIPVGGLSNPAANIQYLASDGTWTSGLPPSVAAATVVMPAGHTEFTVRYHPELSRWVGVIILPGAFFTDQIATLSAPAPDGPWTTPTGVFTYPEMTQGNARYVDDTVFCYAAKEHAEFETAGSSQLVVSYACNSTSLARVANDMNLYVPRFVEIPAP